MELSQYMRGYHGASCTGIKDGGYFEVLYSSVGYNSVPIHLEASLLVLHREEARDVATATDPLLPYLACCTQDRGGLVHITRSSRDW